jgi:hypothetical protein
VLPYWNALKYSNVGWTTDFPGFCLQFPGFEWTIVTEQVAAPDDVPEQHATGGYVIGSFDVCVDDSCLDNLGEYRLQHEYDYFQDPELHEFQLEPAVGETELDVMYVTNLRFGHSYGLLDDEELWSFSEWMTVADIGIQALSQGGVFNFTIDWDGELPFPEEGVIPLPVLLGDFDRSGILDAPDIDMLSAEIRLGNHPLEFDLTQDGFVDFQDHQEWVRVLKQTCYGDADLNQEFNSSDLVKVFVAGKYETGQDAGWEEGNWSDDGVFDTHDLVVAFVEGCYEMGPRAEGTVVPEPGGWLLLLLGTAGLLAARRRD